MPPGARAAGPSSHAVRSGRCQSIGWGRGSRGTLREATGGGCGGGLGQEGTGSGRGDGPCACLPGAKGPGRGCPGMGARSSRAPPPEAEQPCAPAPQGRGSGPHLLRHSPGGPKPPAWPSLAGLAPRKQKRTRPDQQERLGPAGTPQRRIPPWAGLSACPAPPGPVQPVTGTGPWAL